MKSFSTLSATTLITLTLFSSASFASKDDVVAEIGKKKITVEDFNKKFDQVRSRALNPPTKAQFLEDLVRFEVGLQEAEKKNLEKDPLVQQRMKEELYKSLLEKELAQKVEKISVTDKEMESYYKQNPEIRLSYILIEVRSGATADQKAEAKKRALEIYNEVKSSKRSFEDLVKLYSDDSFTKHTGGDAGWQSRATVPPHIYDAILSMKQGEIKGLVEVQFGYQILKVTGRRSFENSNKRSLRASVFDEKRKQLFNEYFDRLKKNYSIKTNLKLIE